MLFLLHECGTMLQAARAVFSGATFPCWKCPFQGEPQTGSQLSLGTIKPLLSSMAHGLAALVGSEHMLDTELHLLFPQDMENLNPSANKTPRI